MKKRRISFGMIVGLLILLAGLIGLYSGPEISQYVFLPGSADYPALMKEAEEKWEDSFSSLSLHGTARGVSLTADSRSQGEITVYEVLGGYAEVYPREYVSGRALSRGDAGENVIVLDEKLAFQLFGDADPIGQKVTIGEKAFEIVGIASHTSRIGETGVYAAWIPLKAEGAPAAETMILSAGGKVGSSLRTIFETGAKEVFGAGEAIFLSKERTRGTVLLRFVVTVIAIWLIAKWIRIMTRWFREWISGLRTRLQTCYPRQMAGALIGRGAEMLLLTILTIAAAALLVVWDSRLMMIFPEWVPEILVDPDSIAQRFRELTALAAAPVQFRTPELAEIKFWSGCVRWGTVISLLFWTLAKRRDA